MSNVFTEREADLVLTRGGLQLQFWHNPAQPGKEDQPRLYALKIENHSTETLSDIRIRYMITEVASPNYQARFCSATGDVLSDQVVIDSKDELAPGAHQYFTGKYWRRISNDGLTGPSSEVITYGFNVSFKRNCQEVKHCLSSCPTGYFFIVSKLNEYVADVRGSNTDACTPLISYPKNGSAGTDNQMWMFEPGPEGYLLIKSKLNGNVIDITGASTAPGAALISFPKNGGDGTDNQLWTLEPDGNGYFFISSKLNGNVMDIFSNSKEPGTALISYPRKSTGTSNQLWQLVPVGQG